MLAYERHGSGEPLVLVHGVTHRRQAWYPVLDQLAEHREVILVDLPGHGAVAAARSATAARWRTCCASSSRQFLADAGPRPPARRRQLPRRADRADRRRRGRRPQRHRAVAGRVLAQRRASSPTRGRSSCAPARWSERLGPRAEPFARTRAGRNVDLRPAVRPPGAGVGRPGDRRRPRLPLRPPGAAHAARTPPSRSTARSRRTSR